LAAGFGGGVVGATLRGAAVVARRAKDVELGDGDAQPELGVLGHDRAQLFRAGVHAVGAEVHLQADPVERDTAQDEVAGEAEHRALLGPGHVGVELVEEQQRVGGRRRARPGTPARSSPGR
jgi:hypothetical protein